MLGDDEVEFRYQVRYRGQAPRRRVPGNLNYYDHNVLGLDNRKTTAHLDTSGDPFFDTKDDLKRNKSVPSLRARVADKVTDSRPAAGKGKADSNFQHYVGAVGQEESEFKHNMVRNRSQLTLRHDGQDASYEDYRKNRGGLLDLAVRPKSAAGSHYPAPKVGGKRDDMPTPKITETVSAEEVGVSAAVPCQDVGVEADVEQVAPDTEPEETTNIKGSELACAGSHTRKALESQKRLMGAKMQEKLRVGGVIAAKTKLRQREKERLDLCDGNHNMKLGKSVMNLAVSSKVTETTPDRERTRIKEAAIEGSVQNLQTRLYQLEAQMSRQQRQEEGLDLPSYRDSGRLQSGRDDYKRSLLDQIEHDRRRRLDQRRANADVRPSETSLLTDRKENRRTQEYQEPVKRGTGERKKVR